MILFIKSQLSAFVGGLIDFGIFIFCTEILGFHYSVSIIFGGIAGAFFNYTINRYWAFNARTDSVSEQIPKYILVGLGSILLKIAGVSYFTEIIHIDYRISKLLADGIVAYGFNFTLHKYWVFKSSQ